MRRFLLWLIRGYRKYISLPPDPRCRFIPTCSAYAYEAIEVHGAWRGGWLAVKRVCKCHPFHKQKSILFDPVPPKKGAGHSP